MKDIGKICSIYRRELGYTLNDVAIETGYTIGNICSFEHGRNDNGTILLWYIFHGLTPEKINLIILQETIGKEP